MRQDPPVRSYAVTHPAGTIVPPQPPGWHQVLLTTTGAMTLELPDGSWFVPPGAAVEVPAGVPHRVRAVATVRLRTLYLRGARPGPARVVRVVPLLRELLLAAVARAPLYPDGDRAAAALLDLTERELAAATTMTPLLLTLPTDPAARRVAERILAAPGDPARVDALCRGCGAGRRTVERWFREGTGLGVAAWRRRARLVAALAELADGRPLAGVAHAAGYATPSAFGAMVKAELGSSPGALVRAP